MTPPLFLVEPSALEAEHVVVDGPEGHHASDVRRLRVGEPVGVGDGAGRLAHGVVAEVSRGRIVVDVHERSLVPAPSPRFVVVQALAKGGRDTDAVEAMTEVGVDEVVAWQSARSVARSTDRTVGKWQAAAREAAKQSRRAWVPEVAETSTSAQVGQRLAAAALAVVLHEDASEPLVSLAVPSEGEVVLVVGPEGGIAPEEIETFVAAGAHVCRLGEGVLRTSTAGVAALSVLSVAARWR